MTLVCKTWKNMVYKNSNELKRAEHAVTTHIITFTEWMDLSSIAVKYLYNHSEKFSWSLARWYCGISQSLETLILDHKVSYIYLANLLHSCPKLKKLQFAYDRDPSNPINEMIPAPLQLRHLEVFLTSSQYPSAPHSGMRAPRQLHRDILVSSDNLRAFRGLLNLEDCFFIGTQKPLSYVFNNLIALDLDSFTTEVINILACTDNLNLKYLRLGYYDNKSDLDGFYDKEKTITALHQLLHRLARLEVLIISDDITVTNETTQLLIDLELSLSVAVFYQAYSYVEGEEKEEFPWIEVDPLQPDVLIDFEDMLLSKNPGVNLSEIIFVLPAEEILENLESEDTGFTFASFLEDSVEEKINVQTWNGAVNLQQNLKKTKKRS